MVEATVVQGEEGKGASRYSRFTGRGLSALPLVVWTLFIWGTRLRNAFDDADLIGADRVQAFATAGVFVALGLLVAVVLWLGRTGTAAGFGRWVIGGTAVFTIVFWMVRMVTIAMGDHTLGFVLVHVVLGLGSLGVSALALRGLRESRLRGLELHGEALGLRSWDSP